MPRKKNVIPPIPFEFKEAVSRLLKVKPAARKARKKAVRTRKAR